MKRLWVARALFVVAWWIGFIAGVRRFGLGGLMMVFIVTVATTGAIISDAALIESEDDSDDEE